MKILYLGQRSPLIDFLMSLDDEVFVTENPVDIEFINASSPDFLVSYNFRHIIPKSVLDRFENKAINLHISFLPWNKGADPNFWSFVEKTPKGVTIHCLDEHLDTGDIIVQKEVALGNEETLATSYAKLHLEIQELFRQEWSKIKNGLYQRKKQDGSGSYHRLKDKEPLMNLLPKGWDTSVEEVANLKIFKA